MKKPQRLAINSTFEFGSVATPVETLEPRTLFSVPTLTGSQQDLGGTIVAQTADPVRNVAYIADQTHGHILAVSTATGTTVGVTTPAANVTGLAVSVDDSRLFASESGAFQIEVFSLPQMTLLITLNVGVGVGQMVAGANDRIIGDTGSITGFNAQTGATLYTVADDYNGIIHANPAGTRLYSRARGLSGNDGSLRAFDISGTGSPVQLANIPGPTGANSTDFAVDTTAGHAYFGDGGGDGVEVTLLSTGNQTNWTFDGGGSVNGLATFPGTSKVFASTFNGVIGEFNETGVELAAWSPAAGIAGQTLVETPNGNVLGVSGSTVNITGLSAVNITQAVPAVASVTTLTSTPLSAVAGASVALTAVVAPANGTGQTPTGTVTFYQNGSLIGTAPLATDGIAALSTTTLPVGSDNLTAVYSGDTVYNPSTSAVVVETVTQPVVVLTSTVTTLATVTPNPASAGTAVTLAGTVASVTAGGPTLTGTVTLSSNSTALGTVSVAGDGSFTFTTTILAEGQNVIGATYNGDATYSVSHSTNVTLAVTPAVVVTPNSSTTTITGVLPSPAQLGTPVVVSGAVAVSSTAGQTATGTVSVFDGTLKLGDAPLATDGTFTFTASGLSLGAHAFHATYDGDSTFTASTSSPAFATVASAVATAAFTKLVLPAAAIAGVKLQATASIVITNGGSTSTGIFTVNYYLNTAPTLDGDQVFLTTTKRHLSLRNNSRAAVSFRLKLIPASLAPGAYHILAEVTNPNGVTQVTATPSTVQVAPPFVAITAGGVSVKPTTVTAGKSFAVFATVTNTGNEIAAGAIVGTLGFSVDGVTASTAVPSVSSQTKIKIAAGKSRRVRFVFIAPAGAPSGAYLPILNLSIQGATTTVIGNLPFAIG